MKYNPNTEKLEEEKPDNGFEKTVEEFYRRIGERFPIKWDKSDRPALPIIKKQNLPSNISVSDVEQVLNEMKSDGWF